MIDVLFSDVENTEGGKLKYYYEHGKKIYQWYFHAWQY